MKKIVILLILSLWIPLALATPMPSLEKLTIMLDSFPNPDHAPLIIAEQQGFFKEQGLTVELREPHTSHDMNQQVLSRKVDIGITYQPQFMEQVDRGLPFIRIGTLIDKPLNCIVVLDNSGIKSLTDLKDKHIGSSQSELSKIIFDTVLAKQGLSNKDIKRFQTIDNLSQALLLHQVDAITGITRNVEVPYLEQEGYKLAVFFPEEHGVPNYSQLIFITHVSNIHDKRFPRFLTAIRNAVEYLDKHPQSTWQQFANRYPESNNKINQEAWFATIPYFAEDPASFDNDEWNNFAQFMLKNKLIKKIQPISRYAVMI